MVIKPSDAALSLSATSMPAAEQSTREKILSTAESLFANRGVDAVSLQEINTAAQQRNRNATQYHFGNKEGLVQAILDKHIPAIAQQRAAMLGALENLQLWDVRSVARAFAHPLFNKLFDENGGQAFICINAQLLALHTGQVLHHYASPYAIGNHDAMSKAMGLAMKHIPRKMAQMRGMLCCALLFHSLADRSQLLRRNGKSDPNADTKRLLQGIEDAIVAIMSAP